MALNDRAVCSELPVYTDSTEIENGKIEQFFLIIGMLSAYLDFLTTETITLTIPLLLWLRIQLRADLKAGESRTYWKQLFISGFLWFIGYAGMWTLKWGISAVILRQNMISFLKDNVELHLGIGNETGYGKLLFEGLILNSLCLFPQGLGPVGMVAALILIFTGLFLPAIQGKLQLRKSIDCKSVLQYVAIGIVPYIRYAAIVHHMWWHYFFTYRAQIATIFTFCLIWYELLEICPAYKINTEKKVGKRCSASGITHD